MAGSHLQGEVVASEMGVTTFELLGSGFIFSLLMCFAETLVCWCLMVGCSIPFG